MPSITYPAGVIFKLTNDTPDVVSLQLLKDYTPHPDTTRPSPIVVLVEQRQPLSLVLQPGVTYRYVLRKMDQAADISSVLYPPQFYTFCLTEIPGQRTVVARLHLGREQDACGRQ